MRALFRPVESDRSALLLCLAIPFAIALVSFVLAVGLTAPGAPKLGTLRSTVAGLSYVYLTLGLMWLPAYGIACGWFWWSTRASEQKLFTRLYTLPLVAALFVWFPALMFVAVPFTQRLRLFPVLALSAVLSGFLWIGLVRLMFYAWRRK